MKRIHFLPVLALVLAVAASAFAPGKQLVRSPDVVYWQFNSDKPEDIRDAQQYTMVDVSELPGCSGTELPCILQTDASVNTQSALQSYLNNTNQFPTEQSIVDQAYDTKD